MRTTSPRRKTAPRVPNKGARKLIAVTSPIGIEKNRVKPGLHGKQRNEDAQAVEIELIGIEEPPATVDEQRHQHQTCERVAQKDDLERVQAGIHRHAREHGEARKQRHG